MAQLIQSLKREAEKRFLGWGPVVGVGITENEQKVELVFLLAKESNEARSSVLDWAKQNHVGVQFIVTGRIKALNRV